MDDVIAVKELNGENHFPEIEQSFLLENKTSSFKMKEKLAAREEVHEEIELGLGLEGVF